MENLSAIGILSVFSIASTFFFLGLSIDTNNNMKILSRILWFLSVLILFICILFK